MKAVGAGGVGRGKKVREVIGGGRYEIRGGGRASARGE